MTLDDRLRTVLDVAADSDDATRAQYRQLVDLLGSGRTIADGALVAAAFLRLASLARRIPADARASILRDSALRLRSAPLVAQLCESEPMVARAAIEAADLDEAGWTVLTSVLDESLQEQVRKIRTTGRARTGESQPPLLLARKPRRASALDELTPSAPVPTRAPVPAPREPDAAEHSEITDVSDIVARIERFRIKRRERATEDVLAAARGGNEAPEAAEAAETSAPPPLATPREIDCRISPEGRLEWAQRLAPMLTGLILSAGQEATARLNEATATALRRQQAVRDGSVSISAAPAISGDWRLDAVPHFDPVGRFLGHHARLTRRMGAAADARGDLVRQALHELRTPINALQGFSEIIQQQLFGPVPHQYRSLAAGIAGEVAGLLAAMEEIDRLVRLRRGTRKLGEGEAAIGPMVAALAEQARPMLAARGAVLTGERPDPSVIVPVDEGELERSLWRLFSTVIGEAGEGDRVAIDLAARGDTATLSLTLPATLAALDDEALYEATRSEGAEEDIAVGLLGRGFALRLATAEARAAGGKLDRRGDRLVLTLPCEYDAGAGEAGVAA